MPTTSNFGWTTPADTDLVKDGAAAIRTLGNGVDSSFVDLKGGTTDQVLAKNSNADMDFKWVAQDDSNAIQNAIVDAKGDLVCATAADTPARLAVGTNDHVLTADSTTATGLKWAPVNAEALTLLSTTTLSGTTNITSISGSYKNLVIYIQDPAATADFNMLLWCNQNTSTSQIHLSNGLYGTSAFNTNNYFYITGLEDINTYTGTAIAMRIENYATTNQTKVITSWGFYRNASNLFRSFRSNGIYNVSGTAITSLRFDTTGGTFNGGTVRIYGEK